MLGLLLSLLILSILASLRLLYILRRPYRTKANASRPSYHILISLGSGGHTAEMLALLSSPTLPTSRYTRRSYVISSGDAFSAEKAREFESGLLRDREGKVDGVGQGHVGERPVGVRGEEKDSGREEVAGGFEIFTVPRARRIHQSLYTTPFSCMRCLWSCTCLLGLGGSDTTKSIAQHYSRPDLILLNGPATSLIILLASLLIRFFDFLHLGSPVGGKKEHGRGEMRTIYIESWARVKTPSLTLRIISSLGLCDRVVVQHRGLEEKGWGEWRGDLMR